MSQQIGNFPTVFRPIQIHNCLKMWPDEWFCFNFVTSMNDLSLVILWSLSVQYIYIYTYIYTHTCLRQSPKCKHIVQCRHLFVCSLCFLKVSSFVSFGGNFLPCFRLFAFGLPRVPRCDCMFHGRITPISSISSSTYPQYTSISSIYYSTQCAI